MMSRGRLAAQYLLKKGHCRIVFLGDTDLPEYAIHPVSLRLMGFRQILNEAGVTIPEQLARLAPYTQEQTRQVASELLSLLNLQLRFLPPLISSLLGVLKAACQLQVKVPNSLAVIGFDDLGMAEYADLTTIRQYLDESGRLAVEILLSHIADPSRPSQHIHIPLSIIERATV
jgi:DNA-binding LacI/PurR family transcriptional regulator